LSSIHPSTPLPAAALACAAILWAAPAFGQVTPAAGYTPPDDTPKINVGATIFADYTVQQTPKAADPLSADDTATLNQFQVGRSYINVTGNVSHSIAFRITPDIARETGTGSSLNGSYTFRLKYAYAQWILDDHMTKGSWARFGIQQTPWVDFWEGIYRYRFQGTIFEDREGFLSSSDAGASFHYNLPQRWGDFHVGVYNGENYNKPEVNADKGWMVRGTVRPLPHGNPLWRGLRLTGFYDKDAFTHDAPRERGIVAVSFEHRLLNFGADYMAAANQPTPVATEVNPKGYSIWVTPRSTIGWEGLLRFDHLDVSNLNDQAKDRVIAGIAYWFPHQGNVSTALLFDVDNTEFKNFAAPQAPTVRNIAVHALVNF
jgi:hypothetical protein